MSDKEPDLRKAFKGDIPWSFKDFNEIVEWEIKLRRTPQDDWNLSEMPKLDILDEETGEVQVLGFNKYHPINQLARHFFSRYRNGDVAVSHLHRYIKVKQFLSKQRERLMVEDWMEKDGKMVGYDTRLLRALCQITYTGRFEEDGESFKDFDYDDVVEMAEGLPEE